MTLNSVALAELDFEVVFEASPELCQQLAEVHCQSFEDGWNQNQFENMLQSENCFSILIGKINEGGEFKEASRNIYGFVVVQKCLNIADILTVSVKPSFQNRGIGKSLLHKTVDTLKTLGVSEFFLEVSDQNWAAIKLYKYLDFTKISIRVDYYPDGSDAILMKKNI